MRESKNQALDKSNCGVARRRGEEAGVKTASPRTETGCEAGDTDKLAPHNGVQDSVSQVKPFDGLTAGRGLCRESSLAYSGRPVRQAPRLVRGAPGAETPPGSGQESAEVVVVPDTSRE